jgi:pyruvate, water dikinase
MRPDSLLRHFACRIFSPAALARKKYAAFKDFLNWDHAAHSQMTKLERIYHDEEPVDFCTVRAAYDGLVNALSMMVENLTTMAPFSYGKLPHLLKRMDAVIRSDLTAESSDTATPFILEIEEASFHDERFVGGKAANLSRLSRELQLPIPKCFVITTSAFNAFCRLSGLQEEIEKKLAALDIGSAASLDETSKGIVSSIRSAPLPPALEDAVAAAYRRLLPGRLCAVRSSAAGEDAEISFAGQYQTVLGVSGENLIAAYKEVVAGKYSPMALSYRIRHGYLDDETPMAVLVMEMIDAKASGVMYTQDPFGSSRDTITIYSIQGAGELLVGGTATPDVTEIRKDDGLQIVTGDSASLDRESAGWLAAAGLRLEAHFGSAQDVEWCMDEMGDLYLLQSRPLRVSALEKDASALSVPEVSNAILLAGGEKAASGVAMGRVFLVQSPSALLHVPFGSVLVAPTTPPQFAQLTGKVKAVVTDVGSVAGHFASVARDSGIPTLVNTRTATKVLKPGQIVTVDADRQCVLAGVAEELLAFSQAQKGTVPESRFRKRLRKILNGVSPLNLIDPKSPDFSFQNCKTLHDLLRFAHEKAVAEMFSLSGKGKRKFRGARKLICDIPIVLYVLDLGGGVKENAGCRSNLSVEDVSSFPFSALWKGLTDIKEAWSSDIVHFDWWNLDRFSLGDGIVSFDSQLLGSFVLVSADYMNANIRFGLHFTVIDSLITPDASDNYVSFRFEGGGAEFEGKHLRAIFLAQVLENHGFQVNLEKLSVSAIFERAPADITVEKIAVIGRLLAFTPLLDMTLKDLSEVGRLVAVFSKKSGGDEGTDESGAFIPESRGNLQSQSEAEISFYRPTWVTDQLAVGHAPMSYEDLQSIKRQGLDAIVNLCAEYRDLYDIEKDYGFDVFYLPVPDDKAPDMDEMDKALAWLDEAIFLEKKVLIHCRLGIGRTGTFLRSYFIRRGFGSELIEERLRSVHSHPTSASQWKLLKKYGRQSERLTIREPSLEAERAVNLGSYFEEYETLCRLADDAFVLDDSPSRRHPDCGRTSVECCKHPFYIQFIEAVYLRHFLIKELSREDRLATIRQAASMSRRVKDGQVLDFSGLIVSSAEGRCSGNDAIPAGEEYRCPLNIREECILYSHRPIRCRVFGFTEVRPESVSGKNFSTTGLLQTLPPSRIKRDLDEISRRLFFALNGRFLEGRSLIFPITHVISGKYIEDYFSLLSELDKTVPNCPVEKYPDS